MEDKVKRYLNFEIKRNFNSIFKSILALMLNLKIYFGYKYKTTNNN